MMLIYFFVIQLLHCTAVPIKHVNVTFGVDLCTRPSSDPCSPGGKWDPLLNKLVYRGIRPYKSASYIVLCLQSGIDYLKGTMSGRPLHRNAGSGAMTCNETS